MKLTRPMRDFLYSAHQMTSPGDGIYFSLWTFGSTLTGRALADRGLIEQPYHGSPYMLSAKGREVAEQICRDLDGSLAEHAT